MSEATDPFLSHASSRGAAIAVCAVGALLLAFALLSWSAARGKSATTDEPHQFMSAWVQVKLKDLRLDTEDPPLWKYWQMLPHTGRSMTLDLHSPLWQTLHRDRTQGWQWSAVQLYRTPGNDPQLLIGASRAMMLVPAVLLGALVALWAWRLAGPVAGVSAAALFCLDPNFLGHAPLLKNDVAMAFGLTGTGYALWRLGKGITAGRVALLCLFVALGVTSKFSGVLLGPLVVLALLVRALMSQPWRVSARFPTRQATIRAAQPERAERAERAELFTAGSGPERRGLAAPVGSRAARLCVALGLVLLAALVSYAAVWLVYGMRFSASPRPDERMNTPRTVATIARNQLVRERRVEQADQLELPPGYVERQWRRPLIVRAVEWSLEKRLLPEAFLDGFLFTYAYSIVRAGYLLGEVSRFGWWYYFPVAVATKTPLATLVAFAAALVLAIPSLRKRLRTQDGATNAGRWDALALLLPAAVYGLAALSSPVNLGLRHLLPVYPMLFIATGCVAGSVWRRASAGRLRLSARAVAAALCLLLAGLTIETLRGYPHYIAFFNTAAGGSRGGLRILGDSNLDWGQDLPLLAQWRREHPDGALFLSYFGQADPAWYGLDYVNLPGGYALGLPVRLPASNERGVVAISATNLQGIYDRPDLPLRLIYAGFRRQEPIEVLGGSIYVYRWP